MRIVPLPLDRVDEIFALYDSFDRPPDRHLPKSQAVEALERIRQHEGEVFVAEQDGKLVATYSIYVCHNLARGGRPFAVIEHVVCLAGYRRQGIGRALMEHASTQASERGCYKVLLETGKSKPENHAFYEACGFTNDKRAYQIRFGP
jgi:GNAT superfamily N-acetyltransferase